MDKLKPIFIELDFIDGSDKRNTNIAKYNASSINKFTQVSIKEIRDKGRGTCKLGIGDPDSKYMDQFALLIRLSS